MATDNSLVFMILLVVGGATYLIGYLLYIGYKMVGNTRNVLVTRAVPQSKRLKYKAHDFYDEPDGFYVTMPDGSIRIDD